MIYLDHAATSPLLDEVREAMEPWFGVPANPSSVHAAGRAAAAAMDRAREEVALLLGRDPAGIVFVSGATEANHAAVRGLAALGVQRFAASPIEHPSVHAALRVAGVAVHALAVGASGRTAVDLPDDVDGLVLMAVNHETGVRQPIDLAAGLVRSRGIRLHIDATQALAGGPVVGLDAADTIALSAHKLGGPAGVGALSLRTGEPFPALFPGAQERGRRAGTANVAGVVGFGAACRIAAREGAARTARWAALAEAGHSAVVALGGRVVGDRAAASPAITTAVFPGPPSPAVRGDLLVQALDLAGIATSSGAACASGAIGPSPVLAAMGDPAPEGGLRVSLGPATTAGEIAALADALRGILPRIREAARWEADL